MKDRTEEAPLLPRSADALRSVFYRSVGPSRTSLAVIANGLLLLAIRIISVILYCQVDHRVSPLVVWLVFTGINLFLLVSTLAIILYHRNVVSMDKSDSHAPVKLQNLDQHPDKQKFHPPKPRPRQPKPTLLGRLLIAFRLGSAMFMVITTIVLLAVSSSALLTQNDYGLYSSVSVAFQSADAAFSCSFLLLVAINESQPFATVAQSLILTFTALEITVGTLMIWASYNGHLHQYADLAHEAPEFIDSRTKLSRAFPYFGLVNVGVGAAGIVAGTALDEFNRLSELGKSLSVSYLYASILGFLVSLVMFIMAMCNITRYRNSDNLFLDVEIADPLLGFAGMVLNIGGILAIRSMRRHPRVFLKVEEYDLNSLTDFQISVWAKLINLYDKSGGSSPDTASGEEALSLMRGYVASPMPNLKCKVLRIFDPEAESRYYESVNAWKKLDTTGAFQDDESTLAPTDKASIVSMSTLPGGLVGAGPNGELSKKQRKKLEKQAQKEAQKSGQRRSVMEVEEAVHLGNERDARFRQELIETEALVLLTCIDDFDLLSPIANTRVGHVLERLVGKRSWLRLTCVRMGLLASHWPFRQAIFTTSPTKKPNARKAAILRSVAKWNSQQPRSQRCTLMLDPTYKSSGSEEIFEPAGWIPSPMPNSHVLDLRPYQGLKLPEFLRRIKYRDRSHHFVQDGGIIIESKDFTMEECSSAMELWWNIASKRVQDGNTPVLQNPTVEFFHDIGTKFNERGFRSLLFLKIGGEVIASCVLFRLGDTVTSDLQGLNHELGRKYGAYFVMMQETIRIALENGLKFVDFGPTTSQPKLDIGCRSVPLVAGLQARPPLSWVVPWFNDQVEVG